MLTTLAKKYLPSQVKQKLKAWQLDREKKRVAALPKLNEKWMAEILTEELGLVHGDTVFIHSSIGRLNLDFPFYQIIDILRDVIGQRGTMLFPTYPKLTSYKFLKSGIVFNVKRTPSYTGLLNEFARRRQGSVRSLHPTKSVCALGPDAKRLTSTHQNSPYPYDKCSPYYRITENQGKIIGIGVNTSHLSFVHTIDDTMKERFPVQPYHDELFKAPCIDYQGREVIVPTYAHNMDKMIFDIPAFVDKYINDGIARNVDIKGMKFAICHSGLLFARMTELAAHGKTIFKKKFYKTTNVGR